MSAVENESPRWETAKNRTVARAGGAVAKNAREDVELRTGKPVITSENATQLNDVVVNMIENISKEEQ